MNMPDPNDYARRLLRLRELLDPYTRGEGTLVIKVSLVNDDDGQPALKWESAQPRHGDEPVVSGAVTDFLGRLLSSELARARDGIEREKRQIEARTKHVADVEESLRTEHLG